MGQIYYSSFTTSSRGVAILVHKSLPLTEVEVKADSAGRYVMIKGTLYGDIVSYLNVYAPPIRSPEVFSLFSEWIVETSVVAGDFNCCLNPRIDRSCRTVQANVGQGQSLLGCCNDLHLIDTWRTLHRTDSQYTFYSFTIHNSSSRIDYFFTPDHALQRVLSCSIGNIIISIISLVKCSALSGNGDFQITFLKILLINYTLQNSFISLFLRMTPQMYPLIYYGRPLRRLFAVLLYHFHQIWRNSRELNNNVSNHS